MMLVKQNELYRSAHIRSYIRGEVQMGLNPVLSLLNMAWYLLGASVFRKVARGDNNYERWAKVQGLKACDS